MSNFLAGVTSGIENNLPLIGTVAVVGATIATGGLDIPILAGAGAVTDALVPGLLEGAATISPYVIPAGAVIGGAYLAGGAANSITTGLGINPISQAQSQVQATNADVKFASALAGNAGVANYFAQKQAQINASQNSIFGIPDWLVIVGIVAVAALVLLK